MNKWLLVSLMAVSALAAPPAKDEAPIPYEFSFQEQNSNHTLARQETGDAQGNVQGQYTYVDKDGKTRTVHYTADPEKGFQAQVDKHEEAAAPAPPAEVEAETPKER